MDRVDRLIQLVENTGAHRATYYSEPNFVVRVTRIHYKRGGFNKRALEFVVTKGRPNYRERDFVKLCKKAGVKFPIRKPQLSFTRVA